MVNTPLHCGVQIGLEYFVFQSLWMLYTYLLSVVPNRFPQTQCQQKHANGDKHVGSVSSALAAMAVLKWIWSVVPPCALNAAGFYCLSSFFVFRTQTDCGEYDTIYSSLYYAATRPFFVFRQNASSLGGTL